MPPPSAIPARPSPAGDAFARRAALLGLSLAILAAYANSLTGAFVFDDQSSVVENQSIRQLWPLGAVLLPPPEAGICGRPLANLTMALNYALHGLDVRGYHAANLAIHLAAALALFALVRETLRTPGLIGRFGAAATPLALGTAALWALHPLQTATVTYISQRVEALMALFYLLTLLAVARAAAGPARLWTPLAVAFCALGMASKEVMITAPVAALLYDRCFLAGSFAEALRRRWRLHGGLAATWLLLAYLMSQAQLAERGIGYALGVSSFDYALAESRAVWTYLHLALWPHPLVFDYGWAFVSGVREAAPYLAVVIPLVGLAAWCLWRHPALGFPAAGFFLVLAPSSSIAPIIQQPIAENRVYLPLAGLAALTVIGLHALGRRAWLGSLVAAAVLGTLTAARNLDYRTPLTLWSDTVAKRPDNARARNNLGSALLADQRLDEAAREFATAARLQPSYPEPRLNLGLTYLRAGRPDLARPWLEAADALRPSASEIHTALGETAHASGQAAEAARWFESALRLNPADARARTNLSVVQLQLGDLAGALASATEAVRRQPDLPEARYNLGNALVRAQRPADAVREYEQAIRLRPDFARAHHNLGTAWLLLGRPEAAIASFEAALRLRPDYEEARRNLTIARQQLTAR